MSPKEAEVYVDGYYAGVVDDFDGVFQRLPIEPGEHDVTLYRDGFRTVHQAIYLTPRSTFKLKYTMEALAAGDVAEPRPVPPNPPPDAQAGTVHPAVRPAAGRGTRSGGPQTAATESAGRQRRVWHIGDSRPACQRDRPD